MSKKPPAKAAGQATQNREDRLKAALKANLARRKAQARAKAEEKETEASGDGRTENR